MNQTNKIFFKFIFMRNPFFRTPSPFILSFFFVITIHCMNHHFTAFTDSPYAEDGSLNLSIPLIKESFFYRARGYLGKLPNIYGGVLDMNHGRPLLLGLYTSTTLLPSNCSHFPLYPVETQKIYSYYNPSSKEETISYPYFEAKGITATFDLFINQHISLHLNAILATNCVLPPNTSFGHRSNALIGMGTANNNDQSLTYFSIYLNQDQYANSLLFYFDPTKAQSDIPDAVLISDSNWHVGGVESIEIGNHLINELNTTLIFDLNLEPIVLPLNIFTPFVGFLNKWMFCNFYEMSSDDDEEEGYDYTEFPFPLCALTFEEFLALPTIVLNVQNQNISIPPEVYLKDINIEKNIATLNVVAVGASSYSKFHITPAYKDDIILGSGFMTFYYTAFEAKNGTNRISVFMANQNVINKKVESKVPSPANNDPPQKESRTIDHNFIFVLFSATLAIFWIGCSFYKKCKKGKGNHQGKIPLLGSPIELSISQQYSD